MGTKVSYKAMALELMARLEALEKNRGGTAHALTLPSEPESLDGAKPQEPGKICPNCSGSGQYEKANGIVGRCLTCKGEKWVTSRHTKSLLDWIAKETVKQAERIGKYQRLADQMPPVVS